VPAILWCANGHTAAIVELSRWVGVICAFFFFGFFDFAAEARKNYRLAFWAFAKRCGFTPPADGSLPFPRLRLPWTKPKPAAPFATSDGGKSLPISLPLTPIKKRPDSSLFGDSRTEYDTSDVHSMEKGMSMGAGLACDYILPSPSSSGPPQYARDIEAGAYAHAHPSPSSTYTIDTDLETDGYSEGQATPTSSQHHLHPTPTSPSDLESQRRTRPTTWPSLHAPRSPHAPAS
jgi:hypothetical protein